MSIWGEAVEYLRGDRPEDLLELREYFLDQWLGQTFRKVLTNGYDEEESYLEGGRW